MRFLITLLINGLILYGAASILSGVMVSSFAEAVIVVLLLALVNRLV